jgi:DDE superfamily endonuclease
MQGLPRALLDTLTPFRPLFTLPTWTHVQLLLMGAILCQGARRVSSILRIMGLCREKRFEKYHRVLNRARWNGMAGARILLGLLITRLPLTSPLLIVVDDTIERRSGKKIKAKGCYRDACRSSEKNIVKCYGLKWVCLMLIVPLPWCRRPWALPFMTLLAPSKKSNERAGKQHRTSIDWTIFAMRVLCRWLKRPWVLIGDGGFACIHLGHACINRGVTLISRLRFDSALYEFAQDPQPGQRGRRREKGKRLPSLKSLLDDAAQQWIETTVKWYGGKTKTVLILSGTCLWYSPGEKPLPLRWVLVRQSDPHTAEAFFSTDLTLEPTTIIEWFVLRWNIEVTFEETRTHLGVGTQRQWSDRAIERSTPALMALFSIVTLASLDMFKSQTLPLLSSSWYDKKGEVTFSDVIAFVRRDIWRHRYFNDSAFGHDYGVIPSSAWEPLLDQLSRAA